jgi:hypothetical protein
MNDGQMPARHHGAEARTKEKCATAGELTTLTLSNSVALPSKSSNSRSPLPEQERCHVDLHLVDQTCPHVLLSDPGTAGDQHIAVSHRVLGFASADSMPSVTSEMWCRHPSRSARVHGR